MQVVIIKYNAGNIQSVPYALERLGIEPVLSDDPAVIRGADKVIFPGVGEASTAMQYLRQAGLDRVIPALTQPFLGVCLGLQLMCAHSEENDTGCLGVFDLKVKRFPRGDQKVPHMGWNLLHDLKSPLLADFPAEPYVYFVHSYYAELGPHTIANAEYMLPFSAALQRDNFYATQFHPEKSGKVGAKLLENFIQNG